MSLDVGGTERAGAPPTDDGPARDGANVGADGARMRLVGTVDAAAVLAAAVGAAERAVAVD